MGVTVFALGKKALDALEALPRELSSAIDCVVVGRDKGIANDYADEIIRLSNEKQIIAIERSHYKANRNTSLYQIAIGWRWLNVINKNQKLIVLHDSLLPHCRGFNPIVTSLINGDKEIGVTAIFGGLEYDKGDIIAQERTEISYPLLISDAFSKVAALYVLLFSKMMTMIVNNEPMTGIKQDESLATYSIWRDESDYRIDWNKTAGEIGRFVDAVGFPYKRALTIFDGLPIRISKVCEVPDVTIVNRDVGKMIFRIDDCPVVICREGLVQVKEAFTESGERVAFDKKFRVRFI